MKLNIRLHTLIGLLIAVMSLTLAAASSQTLAPEEDSWPLVNLVVEAQDISFPSFGIAPADGSNRLFLIDGFGRIFVRQDETWLETPFLDIRDRVRVSGECGLLSMAFPPDFGPDHAVFYVYYSSNQNLVVPEPDTEPDDGCDTVIARFTVTEDANVADPESEEQILVVNQPYTNHNGGQIAFGPDGYLYIGLGDGGQGGDPLNAGQRTDTLLGKILRIEVGDDISTYTVPADNPFVDNGDVRSEIWALGLRNPWRFSFDRLTDDLYIADVGQNQWEEINFQPAGSAGGENYGWRLVEGPECFVPGCDLDAYVSPVFAYEHEGPGCSGSVAGGYVYRGPNPALNGIYLFGDYCTGRLYGLRQVDGGWEHTVFLETEISITSFAEDAGGNLYVMGFVGESAARRGVLYRLEVEDQRILFPAVQTVP